MPLTQLQLTVTKSVVEEAQPILDRIGLDELSLFQIFLRSVKYWDRLPNSVVTTHLATTTIDARRNQPQQLTPIDISVDSGIYSDAIPILQREHIPDEIALEIALRAVIYFGFLPHDFEIFNNEMAQVIREARTGKGETEIDLDDLLIPGDDD